MATGDFTNLDRDHRCPYCGKPVIGTFVQGAEGRYHPECTQPDPPIGRQPYPPMSPGWPPPQAPTTPIYPQPIWLWQPTIWSTATTGGQPESYTVINNGGQ